MWIPLGLAPSMQTRVRARVEKAMVTASSEPTRTLGLLGDESSAAPTDAETSLLRPPSFERSKTSSTVSITLQVSPDQPVAYTVEPASGGLPSQKLTVVYVPLPDDSGFPIQRFAVSDLNTEPGQAAVMTEQDWEQWRHNLRRIRLPEWRHQEHP